jgi:hypothetical protein
MLRRRARSWNSSAQAAASWASTAPPTRSTAGRGTASWWVRTSRAIRRTLPCARGFCASRRRITPPRAGFRAAGYVRTNGTSSATRNPGSFLCWRSKRPATSRPRRTPRRSRGRYPGSGPSTEDARSTRRSGTPGRAGRSRSSWSTSGAASWRRWETLPRACRRCPGPLLSTRPDAACGRLRRFGAGHNRGFSTRRRNGHGAV